MRNGFESHHLSYRWRFEETLPMCETVIREIPKKTYHELAQDLQAKLGRTYSKAVDSFARTKSCIIVTDILLVLFNLLITLDKSLSTQKIWLRSARYSYGTSWFCTRWKHTIDFPVTDVCSSSNHSNPPVILCYYKSQIRQRYAPVAELELFNPSFKSRQSSKAFTWFCRRLNISHYTTPFSQKKGSKPITTLLLFPWKMFWSTFPRYISSGLYI